jgi:hypothetical protein
MTQQDNVRLQIKSEYKRLCNYIVNNINIMSSETAMILVKTGKRSEWRTNFIIDHTYSFDDLDIYKPIFMVDKACYKLIKLISQTAKKTNKTTKLYQILASISEDIEEIYSYAFVDDDYEETEEDKISHFTEWRDDNISKYKEIELICTTILEKIEKT